MPRDPAVAAREPSLLGLVLTELREAWWIYVLVPAALTLLNLGGYGAGSWGQSLLVNFCATVGIGTSTQTAFVIAERRAWSLPYGLHYPLLVLVGVGLGTELCFALLGLFVRFDAAQMRSGMWIIGGTVAALIAMVSITYEHLRARARAVELREEQALRQALQARLDALQSRMNPHFLFNSLNTVAALIEEDPPAAIDAVEHLSELLRYTLERSEERLVPLADELDCVREYLALERARFGARLCASVEVSEPALERCMLPPLTIQPLVENAVKHGVAPSREPVHVRVEVSRAPAHSREDTLPAAPAGLHVVVRDDGRGSGVDKLGSRGTGTAHATLRARLQLLYGERARFEAGPDSERGHGYIAALELPSPAPSPSPSPSSRSQPRLRP